MYFHYLPIQISVILCAFISLCSVLNWMLQPIIEYISGFDPGSWSWTHQRHHVVHVVQLLLYIVHHFPSTHIMVIHSCAPLCHSLVPILGIEVWGVGLRWDGDAGKTRIVSLECECGCLRRMRLFSWCWGQAGCIRVRMELWGIGVWWNSDLMGVDILRKLWGVVLS